MAGTDLATQCNSAKVQALVRDNQPDYPSEATADHGERVSMLMAWIGEDGGSDCLHVFRRVEEKTIRSSITAGYAECEYQS